MAGAGYKLFVNGEVLNASDVNTYLQQQTVMVFADAAARTTALTGVVAEGMISYLKSDKVTYSYNGSTWVAIANSGDITAVTATSPLTGGGTSGDVTLGIQNASTTQLGAVQLTDSISNTSTTTAATPNSVKTAYDLANAAIPSSTLTTAGDILYRSGSAVTRLGIGTAGQVLTVNGGATAPQWATPSGGSGGFTLLSTSTMNSGTTSYTVSGISTSYKNLKIVVKNMKMDTGGASWTMRLNSDTGSNYLNGYVGQYWGGAANNVALQTSIFLASRNSNSASWNKQGYGVFTLTNYGAAGQVPVEFKSINHDGGAGTDTLWYTSGLTVYNASSAVSSVTFIADTNFISGTILIYGEN